MLDLYNNKYSRDKLKEHIYAVAMIDILKTQDLDCSFCVKYILSENSCKFCKTFQILLLSF